MLSERKKAARTKRPPAVRSSAQETRINSISSIDPDAQEWVPSAQNFHSDCIPSPETLARAYSLIPKPTVAWESRQRDLFNRTMEDKGLHSMKHVAVLESPRKRAPTSRPMSASMAMRKANRAASERRQDIELVRMLQ